MIFILIVILFIDETKETVIRPQQTKEQAYRLLKNIIEIKKSSVHNLNPL